MNRYLMAGLMGFALAWLAQEWRHGSEINALKAGYEKAQSKAYQTYIEALDKEQAKAADLARQLAESDANALQELTRAQAENQRLRELYSGAVDARKRLQIAIDTAASQERLCTNSTASGLDDAATVELAPEAGQIVWDLRADIINDRAKLETLQDYICRVIPDAPYC